MSLPTTRRSFMRKTATAFSFTFMPSYLALGKEDSEGNLPPSKRVNLAAVGCGGRARSVVPGLIKGGAKPVALCDVDFNRGDFKNYPDLPRYADFREMMDKHDKDIDIVSVVTPDHSHFCAAMDAIRRGKHVYVEKPLAHNFRECELLMQAAAKHKVVTQMGNQGHTGAASAQFKQMVENGTIKNVKHIDAWKSSGLWFMNAGQRIKDYPAEEPKPASLNWDLWCGPKEVKPFSKKYHPFNWRAFHLYGMGMLGDWGCHIIDMAHDYLNLGLPTEITNIKMDDHNEVIFPLNSQLSMKFPARGKDMPECTVIWKDGAQCQPTLDEKYWHTDDMGKKIKPKLGGAGTVIHIDGEEYAVQRGSHGGSSRLLPYTMNKEMAEKVKAPKVSGSHTSTFVDACMEKGETTSPFDVAAPLTQVLCLGAICQLLNPEEPLKFDPKKKQFTNNDRANQLLEGPKPRKGYEDYYKAV